MIRIGVLDFMMKNCHVYAKIIKSGATYFKCKG